jgi:hypothetical protein
MSKLNNEFDSSEMIHINLITIINKYKICCIILHINFKN